MPDPSHSSDWVHLLFWLVVGHQLMDFALQTPNIAIEKNRHSTSPLQNEVPWFYWMTAHAFLHGGFVAWVTGQVGYGLLETVIHWIIDFAKCERWTNIHVDQILHYLCKVLWVVMIANGVKIPV
jgi:hypothetical protein